MATSPYLSGTGTVPDDQRSAVEIMAGGFGRVFNPARQDVDRQMTQLRPGHAHRRQRGGVDRAERDIVDADNRNVIRNMEPMLLKRADCADRNRIVVSEKRGRADGIGATVEVLAHVAVSSFECRRQRDRARLLELQRAHGLFEARSPFVEVRDRDR